MSAPAPVDWSTLNAATRVRILLITRGFNSRRLAWGVSSARQAEGHPLVSDTMVSNWLREVRPAPAWFWTICAALLDVPESALVDSPATASV